MHAAYGIGVTLQNSSDYICRNEKTSRVFLWRLIGKPGLPKLPKFSTMPACALKHSRPIWTNWAHNASFCAKMCLWGVWTIFSQIVGVKPPIQKFWSPLWDFQAWTTKISNTYNLNNTIRRSLRIFYTVFYSVPQIPQQIQDGGHGHIEFRKMLSA